MCVHMCLLFYRINNCVGELNQKYFIQFLFYTGMFLKDSSSKKATPNLYTFFSSSVEYKIWYFEEY